MCFCSNLFNKSLCTVALSGSINKDDVSWCVVQPEHAHALQTLPAVLPRAKDRNRVILSSSNYSLHHILKMQLLFD